MRDMDMECVILQLTREEKTKYSIEKIRALSHLCELPPPSPQVRDIWYSEPPPPPPPHRLSEHGNGAVDGGGDGCDLVEAPGTGEEDGCKSPDVGRHESEAWEGDRCAAQRPHQLQHACVSTFLLADVLPTTDAALVASFATTELLPTTPTKCSTAGLYQSTSVPVMAATMALVTLSTSSTSALPQDAPTTFPMATSQHPAVVPTRCSKLGLYQTAHVPESATMASALLSAPSTSTISKHPAVAHSRCNHNLLGLDDTKEQLHK
nr:unnamed protein product [Digitaria exilis]